MRSRKRGVQLSNCAASALVRIADDRNASAHVLLVLFDITFVRTPRGLCPPFMWLTGAETLSCSLLPLGLVIPEGYMELLLSFAIQPCTAQTVEG